MILIPLSTLLASAPSCKEEAHVSAELLSSVFQQAFKQRRKPNPLVDGFYGWHCVREGTSCLRGLTSSRC